MLRRHMVNSGDLVVVALSGGKDSVCLLVLLEAIREELGISLCAMHVHHGIRGEEADRDEEFCRRLCGEREIPFEAVRVNVPAVAAAEKMSMEEAARAARYEALESYRRRMGAAHIAVAHHQNDNAETVLWNLFRGSGLQGLGGIKPVNGAIIRPLLELNRAQLDDYAAAHGLSWREDSTNQTDHYTRNRIRRHVLPFITREVNDRAVSHICQAASLAAEADEYLQRQADRWIEQPGHMEGPAEKSQIRLDAAALAAEEPVFQAYVIRAVCRRLTGPTDLTGSHVKAVQSLLANSPGASAHRSVSLIHGMQVRREYDRLVFSVYPAISPERYAGDQSERREGLTESSRIRLNADVYEPLLLDIQKWEMNIVYQVQWGGRTFKFRIFTYNKKEKFPLNRYTKWLNYDKIKGSLVLRGRETGDFIKLSGGGTKSIKSYMVDEKIPADSRDRIPVLADSSHILWIVGYRISEQAKITADTGKILEITMCGGENDGNSS